MKLSSFTAILLSAAMLAATGCSAGKEKEDMKTLSEKSFSASDEYVKEIGRTYYSEDGVLWLAQSASGAEFTFNGTSASVVLKGDSNAASSWGKDNYARYVIYVNGEKTDDAMMNEASRTVEIFSSDSEKETTVKILKVSECVNSTLGIESINVTSIGNIHPTEEKELKIEFIGDSITCGYGVDDEVKEHHFKTDTEDATKAYAVKTAALLNADYSLVSFSGHGIISGYSGDGKIHADQTVSPFYTKVGKTYGGKCGSVSVGDVDWDFKSFVPDVIVINLGTNDDSYTGTDTEKQRAYIDGYIDFLGVVRENNPDAHILCTLGVMGDRLYPSIETAVSEYTAKTGDSKITSMKFDVQNPEDGYAADWHPTEATHTKASEKLAEEIKKIIGG